MLADLASFSITLAVLIAVGFPLRSLLRRAHVPPAVSLMLLGALAGPAVLDLLPAVWLEHAWALSRAAFALLLLRAGLGIPIRTLREIAAPTLVFGVLPVAVELLAVSVGARLLFFDRWDLCVLAGFLVAAVSPAVVLPAMIEQKDAGRGGARAVPDRIIGQTVINALIAQSGIVFLLDRIAPPAEGESHALLSFPLALAGGLLLGWLVGAALGGLFGSSRFRAHGDVRETAAGRSWLPALLALAAALSAYFGAGFLRLESVLATLAVGIVLRRLRPEREPALRARLKTVWSFAEVFLFVNLGMLTDLRRLGDAGLVLPLLALFALALALRILTTGLLARRTVLEPGERRFAMLANLPKATIQAVFGPIVFARLGADGVGLDHEGQTLLLAAVLAIVATAPIGAVLLDRWGERLLAEPDDGHERGG